jgi:hypothetical protein
MANGKWLSRTILARCSRNRGLIEAGRAGNEAHPDFLEESFISLDRIKRRVTSPLFRGGVTRLCRLE